jgi:hypothetical protein
MTGVETWWTVGALAHRFRPVYPDQWDSDEGGSAWERWQRTMALLAGDPVDVAIMDELDRRWLASGEFKDPIGLDVDELLVTDGTHRVAVLLRRGDLDARLSVTTTRQGYRDRDVLHVQVTLPELSPEALELADHELFNRLRSLPLPDAWANCDAMFGGGGPQGSMVMELPLVFDRHVETGDVCKAVLEAIMGVPELAGVQVHFGERRTTDQWSQELDDELAELDRRGV